MITKLLDKTKHIGLYRYDELSSTFIAKRENASLLRSLVEIINILSEHDVQFFVDDKYNININLIDLEPTKAFVVSLDCDANIIDINDIALNLSGYSKKQLIGKNYFDIFITPEDKDEIVKVFSNVLSGHNNYWKHKNNIILKDGTLHCLNWSNALVTDKDENVKTIHAFGILVA